MNSGRTRRAMLCIGGSIGSRVVERRDPSVALRSGPRCGPAGCAAKGRRAIRLLEVRWRRVSW